MHMYIIIGAVFLLIKLLLFFVVVGVALFQDSGDICKELGLCNTTITSQPHIAHPNKLLAKSSPAKLSVADDECVLCKEVVEFLKEFVDSNKTEAEVKSYLVEACSVIPSISSAVRATCVCVCVCVSVIYTY